MSKRNNTNNNSILHYFPKVNKTDKENNNENDVINFYEKTATYKHIIKNKPIGYN